MNCHRIAPIPNTTVGEMCARLVVTSMATTVEKLLEAISQDSVDDLRELLSNDQIGVVNETHFVRSRFLLSDDSKLTTSIFFF
jgi:hypothetical protein